jgi:ribose-phosphate pyrophosphokinase
MMLPPSVGMYGEIKLISGTSHPGLAQEIADYLSKRCGCDVTLAEREIFKFPNDNTYVQLSESIRGQDVYIIQTTSRPCNDNIMELLILLDAVRRDSPGRVTAVVPYMAYSRSDRKDLPRTAITARLLADMIQVAGADRYITIDLHASQIQGFFKIPGDVLTAFYILRDYIQSQQLEDLTVVTTDLGFAKGGRNWGRALGVPLAFVEKKRVGTRVEALSLVGSVEGRNILLVDDEVDTAASVCEAVNMLDGAGAKEITVAFTHPVFSPPALERLAEIQHRIREIVFTNTIPLKPEDRLPNMTVLSVADLIGEVIYRSHQGISVGALFGE